MKSFKIFNNYNSVKILEKKVYRSSHSSNIQINNTINLSNFKSLKFLMKIKTDNNSMSDGDGRLFTLKNNNYYQLCIANNNFAWLPDFIWFTTYIGSDVNYWIEFNIDIVNSSLTLKISQNKKNWTTYTDSFSTSLGSGSTSIYLGGFYDTTANVGFKGLIYLNDCIITGISTNDEEITIFNGSDAEENTDFINNNCTLITNEFGYYNFEAQPIPGSLVISENTWLTDPLIVAETITIEQGVKLSVLDPMTSLIIQCDTLINNGSIDVTGKGFQGGTTCNYKGIGYCDSGYDSSLTKSHRKGGGAPGINYPSAYKTMQGLANAVGGDYKLSYGPGYDGTYGGGGGGGDDGAGSTGGGSGAGGGGGGAGHGSYQSPSGGNGSQADSNVNLQLFKNNQLEEIPLFGASGSAGWGGNNYESDAYDTSNGGGNIQIYANTIINNGSIIADGETIYLRNSTTNDGCGGGGGGCIMMRYTTYTNNGTVQANGSAGHQYRTYYYGGNGGNGLILLDDSGI